MEEKFEVFEEEKFNRILNLVEYVDPEAIMYYKKMILNISQKAVKSLSEGENIGYNNKDIQFYVIRTDNGMRESIKFVYENVLKGFRINLEIAPIEDYNFIVPEDEYGVEIQEEFKPKDIPLFIFSLSYLFLKENKSIGWEAYVQNFDDEYQVLCEKYINGKIKSQKHTMMGLNEVLEFAGDEEFYDEDEEDEIEDDVEFILLGEKSEYDEVIKELRLSALFKSEDVEIDEESGEPEVEVEFFDNEVDNVDDETDDYSL